MTCGLPVAICCELSVCYLLVKWIAEIQVGDSGLCCVSCYACDIFSSAIDFFCCYLFDSFVCLAYCCEFYCPKFYSTSFFLILSPLPLQWDTMNTKTEVPSAENQALPNSVELIYFIYSHARCELSCLIQVVLYSFLCDVRRAVEQPFLRRNLTILKF